MKLVPCQCEHESHFWKKGEQRKLSPNGNLNHRYGHAYVERVMSEVQTSMGKFTICDDCKEDCRPQEK